MKIITDEHCTDYSHPGHPERPERVSATWRRLRTQTELPITWAKPGPVSQEALLRAHSTEHLARLNEPHDFDPDTPFFPNIARHAEASVGAALEALKAARSGETGLETDASRIFTSARMVPIRPSSNFTFASTGKLSTLE